MSSTYVNRIGKGVSPNGTPFVNDNQSVLDKLSQIDGYLYYNGNLIGRAIDIVSYNNENLSENSDSSSSYNEQYNNVQKIIFQGATVYTNPYNQRQVFVKINNIEDYIRDETNIINDYYHIKEINMADYNASVKDYLICNNTSQTIIRLPNASNMDYIKIATLQNINENNPVRIVVSVLNTYINSTNQLQLTINTPYSSVQLVYSESHRIWRVLIPFIPMERSTQGITIEQSNQIMRKNMLIFG